MAEEVAWASLKSRTEEVVLEGGADPRQAKLWGDIPRGRAWREEVLCRCFTHVCVEGTSSLEAPGRLSLTTQTTGTEAG